MTATLEEVLVELEGLQRELYVLGFAEPLNDAHAAKIERRKAALRRHIERLRGLL